MKKTNSEVSEVEKLVYVGRCSKVVKGGRRFSFVIVVVVGDKKGKVGVSKGKGLEISGARAKAVKSARKSMVRIPLRDSRTLHHNVEAKFGATKVMIFPAPSGTGLVSGGAVRPVLEALGIRDAVTKIIGSSNPHNVLKATLKALKSSNSPKVIAEKRGKKVSEIVSRREVHKSITKSSISTEIIAESA